jgi:hypothetical protein
MNDVRTYLRTGCVATQNGVSCHITVLQKCKCTCKFYYIYLISINMLNVIIVTAFQLIIFAAHNFSCIKNGIADFGFMVAY